LTFTVYVIREAEVKGEGELTRFDEPQNLADRFADASPVQWRISVDFSVPLELLFVEDEVRKIGFDQHVNIQVNVGEDAVLKKRRGVHVTVEFEQAAAGGLEAEDAVPAVSPVKFGAQSPRLDEPYERVADLFCENAFED
jgi:hypothetical protein